MHVRRYESADWSAICAVHDAARRVELEWSGGSERFVPLGSTSAADDLLAHEVWVADDGALRGFAAVRGAHVGWLYVDPAYARQGVGRLLLRHAVAHCRPPPATIGALVGNAPALRLYASEGFVVTRRLQIHLSGNPRFPAEACFLEKAG